MVWGRYVAKLWRTVPSDAGLLFPAIYLADWKARFSERNESAMIIGLPRNSKSSGCAWRQLLLSRSSNVAVYCFIAQHFPTFSARRLDLKTKLRNSTDGTESGGVPFSRGHIYQILTNPLYAGRIRHQRVVHDGQHPALIDPERWERIKQMLQEAAAKERRSRSKTTRSLLCGKLFDETGDRLTPSHTKMRTGKRLRYYVSHRLIANSGKDRDGWRLPAAELETQVAALIRKHLLAPSFARSILLNPSANDIQRTKESIADWLDNTKTFLRPIKEIRIAPGQITTALNGKAIAEIAGSNGTSLSEENLTFSTSFQLRKRGVETKLIFADQPAGRDPKLIANIAKAHTWFAQIKSGQTLDQIAASETTSKRRIQQMIDLVFLAPDIIRDVLDGKQPIRFTSDWAKKHDIPSDWDAQRKLLATL